MSKDFKYIFWGTPDVASETLDILKKNGYIPSLIITSIDKPQGRKMNIASSPVKIWAIQNNIDYIQPAQLKDTLLEDLIKDKKSNVYKRLEDFDLSIVVAYGKIIPETFINAPKLGSINIHYSILPKYRGASPVESVILNGDTETGVTIQQMKYKMDSGPILALEKTLILPNEKTTELRNRLINIGGELLVKNLSLIINREIEPVEQKEEEATFCKKITKEDGLINLNDKASINYNKFRAYNKWPRTYFIEENKRIIITDAIIENEKFKILKVIPEGRKEIVYRYKNPQS